MNLSVSFDMIPHFIPQIPEGYSSLIKLTWSVSAFRSGERAQRLQGGLMILKAQTSSNPAQVGYTPWLITQGNLTSLPCDRMRVDGRNVFSYSSFLLGSDHVTIILEEDDLRGGKNQVLEERVLSVWIGITPKVSFICIYCPVIW